MSDFTFSVAVAVQRAARSESRMFFNVMRCVLSPKIGAARRMREPARRHKLYFEQRRKKRRIKDKSRPVVLSITSDTQLPQNPSTIEYTNDVYEPRCGTEISCRRRNLRSPLRHIPRTVIIGNTKKESTRQSHRPSATARRCCSQSDGHTHTNH